MWQRHSQDGGEEELSPPLGLRSITGNGEVTLVWFTSNFEDDFEGYIVFQAAGDRASSQSTTLPSGFVEVERIALDSSGSPRSVTIDGLTNGSTVSFAVCAFKGGGAKISRTSNMVADTPRPDIERITLTSASTNDVAPGDGYAGNGESVLLTVGHVYAVRTGANRFGKIIVTTIVSAPDFTVTFNAAFQTKTGDPNYMRALGIHR